MDWALIAPLVFPAFTERWFKEHWCPLWQMWVGTCTVLQQGCSCAQTWSHGARLWWRRAPGGRPRECPASWRRGMSFWFCLVWFLLLIYFLTFLTKLSTRLCARSPSDSVSIKGMISTVGPMKGIFQISCIWQGRKTETSLLPLLQALDVASLRPSPGQINQRPLSVKCIDSPNLDYWGAASQPEEGLGVKQCLCCHTAFGWRHIKYSDRGWWPCLPL